MPWIIQLIRDFLILDYKSAFFIIEFIFGEQIKYHKTFKYFEQNKIDETNKRIRYSNFNNIEDVMMMWFNQTMLNKNITVDGNILKAQAIKFATYFQEKMVTMVTCFW